MSYKTVKVSGARSHFSFNEKFCFFKSLPGMFVWPGISLVNVVVIVANAVKPIAMCTLAV